MDSGVKSVVAYDSGHVVEIRVRVEVRVRLRIKTGFRGCVSINRWRED